MKLLGQLAAVAIAVTFLAALGGGVYLAIDRIMTVFARLEPTVATVTGIASLVVLLSTLAIERAITSAGRAHKAMAWRDEKTQAYQLLLDAWAMVLGQSRTPTPLLQTDVAGRLETLDRLLAVYGSAPVVQAHTALRRLVKANGRHHPDVRARFGQLVVALRRDLGVDESSMAAGELEALLLPAHDADATADIADARLSTAAI
jgi:hypothetical protein